MAKAMDGRRPRTGAVLALVAAAAALAAGCGGSGTGTGATSSGDAPARRVVQVTHAARDRWTYARERFNETCAGCHTLADAGASGRRFDLDHAGKLEENHVRWAIANGEPGMPAWKHVLSKREYEELVAYVVAVAQNTPGDTRWNWQIKLRMEGEAWRPEDAKR